MAKKTNFTSKGGKEYFRISRKVGKKLSEDGLWVNHYKEFYGSSKKEAEAKYQEYMDASSSALITNKCIGELIDIWQEEVFDYNNLADGTKKLYKDVYKKYFRESPLASRSPADISAPDIQKFLNESDHIPYNSKKRLRTYLKKFFDYAEMNKIASVNLACVEVHRPAEDYLNDTKPVEVWPMEDVKKVIEVTSGTQYRFLIVMAVNTGLRFSELLALDYDDIHDGYVHVTKQIRSDDGEVRLTKLKTKSSIRKVPLSTYVLDELEKHKNVQKKDMRKYKYITNHVFSSSVGTYFDRHNVANTLREIYAKNNIPYHKFHAYRHTYGTNLDMLGFRVSEIKELMGHSSVETTLKYVHACDERKEESSEKLSSLCM